MERLTKLATRHTGNKYVSAIGSSCGAWPRIIQRLAAYENTGLEPEEIVQHGWIPVSERLPFPGHFVPVVVSGRYKNLKWEHAIQLAEYFPEDGWILEGWPEATDITVSHWFELPEIPGEEE